MGDQRSEERRPYGRLSEDEIEAIARRAAEIIANTQALQAAIANAAAKVVEANFTLEVGKVTIRGFLYLCGLGGAALLAWLGVSGKLPRWK